ncbi:MAG: phosphate-binding protein [Methanobacteriota archaeon]|nr:MAG: phosphate-binding protein [Euryarchaeota archaeon]
MKRRLPLVMLVLGITITLSGCVQQENQPIETKTYEITIKGSDTMVQMVSDLAEAFAEKNPGVKITVTGGGSGTGIAALLNKEVVMANASRKIKEKELETAKNRGLDLVEIVVARDAISVVVNPENPVDRLTIDQIAKIYRGEITNWEQVGGKNQPITLYGRQSVSGTYHFFRKFVVKGEYSPDMRNMEGNTQIRDAIIRDPTGIGYIGIGYLYGEGGEPLPGLKPLAVAKAEGGPYVSPLDREAVIRGEYPITRPLYQYIAKAELGKDSSVYRFIEFELSQDGVEQVIRSGFFPPTEEDREKNVLALEQAS